MRILKVFSVLLCYPTVELQEAITDIRSIVQAEPLINERNKEALGKLLDQIEQLDIYELEENYVLLFDRSRSLSLNLFEHVHGESRDRGSAMVDLLHTYQAAGFDLSSSELPDHLPVLLEFLSTRPQDEARALLQDAGAILLALADRLQRRETPYAAVLQSLVTMAGVDRHDSEAAALMAEKLDDPEDLQALDAVWEETAVTFGPESMDSCAGLLSGRPVAADLGAAEQMLRAQLADPAFTDNPAAEFPIHIQRSVKAQPQKGGSDV